MPFPMSSLFSLVCLHVRKQRPHGGPRLGEGVAWGVKSSVIVVYRRLSGEPRALFTAGAPFRVYQGRVLIRRATV